jgi:hypothetical protein
MNHISPYDVGQTWEKASSELLFDLILRVPGYRVAESTARNP